MNEVTPAPTEKSQIVVAYTSPQPTLVVRFSSVKKGEKEFDSLKKAWGKWVSRYNDDMPRLYDINGDMFITTVDMYNVASVSFVDHVKRAKFTPV